MNTRDIRTSTPIMVCDVCGRTLLRGERAHVYLDGPTRHSVCELCTSRALHEGWVREGAELPYTAGRGGADRRRSLLGRLRGRRERSGSEREEDELAGPYPPGPRGSLRERLRARDDALSAPEEPAGAGYEEDDEYDYEAAMAPPPPPPPPVPAPAPAPAPRGREGRSRERRSREPVREPRHVRAIPANAEQKFAAAIDVFNGSEHRRTVAGVARSLGMPTVAVMPVDTRPGLVTIVASWELCWYRYEVDLSEDRPDVRVAAQGYELDELQPAERQPNAVADDSGALALA